MAAIFFPSSVRYIKPASVTVIYFFSLRFFIATLTLDFLNPSSLEISTERTTGSFLLKTSIVSR